MLIALTAVFLFCLNALATELYEPEYHLDLTLSYDFSTTTAVSVTATVVESNCVWCLKNLNPRQCLVFCGDKIIIN